MTEELRKDYVSKYDRVPRGIAAVSVGRAQVLLRDIARTGGGGWGQSRHCSGYGNKTLRSPVKKGRYPSTAQTKPLGNVRCEALTLSWFNSHMKARVFARSWRSAREHHNSDFLSTLISRLTHKDDLCSLIV